MDPFKVAERQCNRRLPTSQPHSKTHGSFVHGKTRDLKRSLDRKAKVKVSTAQCLKAKQMVQEESAADDRKMSQEKPKPAASPTPVTHPPPKQFTVAPRADHIRNDNCNENDNDVTETDNSLGFGALLSKGCSTRLHGDITDKRCTLTQVKKRALRFGDRLHTAMEVVEIVVHGNDNGNNNSKKEEEEGGEEEIQRVADVSSLERCQAWVELHFDTDDASSQSSAER